MNCIFTRRSIRKYTDRPIRSEDLLLCIKAAMYAPSAGNEQAWEFIVSSSKDQLLALSSSHPYGKPLDGASAAVTICGNLKNLKYPQEYWIEDCSAAAQNLMLQATELGIGSVWLAVYPCEDRIKNISSLLSLPDYVIPLCIISLGYPAEEKSLDLRFKPEKIHDGTW